MFIGGGVDPTTEVYKVVDSSPHELWWTILTQLRNTLEIGSGFKIEALTGSSVEVDSGATLDVQNGSTCNLNTATVNMANLPTSDPSVAGRLWNNSGVVTVSAG